MPNWLLPKISYLKNKATLSVVCVIIAISIFGSGFFVGQNSELIENSYTSDLENAEEGKPSPVDFSKFWKAWNILNEKYVTTKKLPTSEERVWGAIGGMTDSFGDPYTVFLPPEDKKIFEEQISGNFEGVGMEIDAKEGIIVVVNPLKGNPAEKAGIKAGDKIIKIEDENTTGMTVEEAVKKIRGKKGTVVSLTLSRESRPDLFTIKVTRDTIIVPTTEITQKSGGIFILKLHSFSAVSPSFFRDGLRQFVESGSDKLILDLRNNPGGYLEASVDMASWFLPVGEVVVREEKGRNGSPTVYRSRGYNVFPKELKMVILVNQNSASASEILAGALKEHGRAKLVGEKTYGKGSVQELIPLTDDSSLKITIARWLTPKGVSISEGGLTPDYPVEMTVKDIEAKKDPQMDKAIEVLRSWK